MIIEHKLPESYNESDVTEAMEVIKPVCSCSYNEENHSIVIELPDFSKPQLVFGIGMLFGGRLLATSVGV